MEMQDQQHPGSAAGMIVVAGGEFVMGSDAFYPEERPAHPKTVRPFLLDAAPVTNREFAAFVAATGHVTTAELELPFDAGVAAGSMVFRPTPGPVPLHDWRAWWVWVEGACWRAPEGPGSDIADRADHPVVHVSQLDALAYAAWAGKRLPTEAEHEFASGAGERGAVYAWGDSPPHPDDLPVNVWQGRFPWDRRPARGWVGTSPVGAFPADRLGFLDLIGNVWEWTGDPWSSNHAGAAAACCAPRRVEAGAEDLRVIKGGSHLCAPEYCHRYRPAARSSQSIDSSSSHLGFRCAADLPVSSAAAPEGADR